MTNGPASKDSGKPSAGGSVVLFILVVSAMVLVKLLLFPERYVGLGYALPLLLCLWHKDRRLLWAMAGTFAVISALKVYLVLPGHRSEEPFELLQWLMQLTNISVVAATVHAILNLTERLRRKNVELRTANEELVRQREEIERQNTALHVQSEELAQQNEESGRQNEELVQQADELERQSEELQRRTQELEMANEELHRREHMLQTLLGSLSGAQTERQMLERACRTLMELVGQSGTATAVLEREGEELRLLTQAGPVRLTEEQRRFDKSFAALVMEHDRTAFVDDLAARPDLVVPQSARAAFRSVLAAPLRLQGKPVGVVKVYSPQPQRWTSQQFRVIEWVAAQCSLALGIMRLQENLVAANASLAEQVRERTAELQEMVNELEHFSYTITHDMRAPLRAIRGFAGTLEELLAASANPGQRDCLERISNSARRMDRLITDALSYSKAVKHELALVPVDAERLLRGIIESYPAFQPPRARIEIAGAIPKLRANEAGLTQCFSNLLDNAVKFVPTERQPEVHIRAESIDGVARLWFEDNGIGIPESFRPRLFQMFQRASRAYEGTGIGLALVRKVAEKMGGRVGVESASGQGSRFWLELPLAGVPGQEAPGPEPTRGGEPDQAVDETNRRDAGVDPCQTSIPGCRASLETKP